MFSVRLPSAAGDASATAAGRGVSSPAGAHAPTGNAAADPAKSAASSLSSDSIAVSQASQRIAHNQSLAQIQNMELSAYSTALAQQEKLTQNVQESQLKLTKGQMAMISAAV